MVATEGCPLLCIREMCVRPGPPGRPAERCCGTLFGNALRIVGVGGELNSETRGIDVTRRAESIGEGIRVWGDV